MLDRVHHLDKSGATATDGVIGHANDVFFHDVRWTIRDLVVDTGHWLSGRAAPVSPCAVKPLADATSDIDVRLTRQQVTDRPDVDAHQPVARHHAAEFVDDDADLTCRDDAGLWSIGANPYFPEALPTDAELAADQAARDARAANVEGHAIQASDASIDPVSDWLFDLGIGAIRYFVVETRHGRPERAFRGALDRRDRLGPAAHAHAHYGQVRSSPACDDGAPEHRDDETRPHSADDRTGDRHQRSASRQAVSLCALPHRPRPHRRAKLSRPRPQSPFFDQEHHGAVIRPRTGP